MSALRGLVEGISTSGPERRAALTTEGVLVLAVAWAVHQGEVEGEAAWQLVVLALGFATARQWEKYSRTPDGGIGGGLQEFETRSK